MELRRRASTHRVARTLRKELSSTPKHKLKGSPRPLSNAGIEECSTIMPPDNRHSLPTLDGIAADIHAESSPAVNKVQLMKKGSEQQQVKVTKSLAKQLEEMRPKMEESAEIIDRANEKLRSCEALMCHHLMAGHFMQDQGITFTKELKRHKQLTALLKERFGEELPQSQGSGVVKIKTSYQLLQSLFD